MRDLQHSLDELEQTNWRMRDVFHDRGAEWKLALVRLRKVQSDHLAALSGSLTRWSEEHSADPDRKEAIRLFVEMRHAIATTQAEWPLSLINDVESHAAYAAASRRAIRASEAFFAWTRARLVRP